MFLLLFYFCSNLCYITLRLCNFYTSIYGNNSLLNVKIGQYWQKIQVKLARFWRKICYFAMALESVRQFGFTQCRYAGSQRRAENREVQTTFSVISGQWVGRESRHIEGVYLTLCLRRVESCKFIIVVSNMVNGRCPGCDYINPVETL